MIMLGLAALNAVVLTCFLAPPGFWLSLPRIDLEVYRLGTEVWLAGGDLYGLLPPTSTGYLPFTYPPFAAVLFTPFAVVPYPLAGAALTLLSVAALVVVIVVVLRALGVRPAVPLLAALVPLALLLEPVRATLFYGQVNLVLMAAVVLDCLVRRPRWPRGVLVGLAAAVKLTPAAFVLFFLLRGDRRAAVTAVVSFLGAVAVGFALNPGGSVRYWTDLVFDPTRIGAPATATNQSLTGLLSRLGVEPGGLWLVLAFAVVGVGALAVRRLTDPVEVLGLNAFVVLLASPVSWSHHWVWCVPALLVAWRMRPVFAVGGVLVFLVAPHWWTAGEFVLGNTYVWCAVAVLAFAVWSADRQLRRPGVHVDHRAVA
jgi:alpha-1,2-mannosyltransferase